MAECNTQRTPNLLLIYGQHPDFKVVRSYERWREEHRSVKVGEHGITYMISTEYEKRRRNAERVYDWKRI
mgnify:FL=1